MITMEGHKRIQYGSLRQVLKQDLSQHQLHVRTRQDLMSLLELAIERRRIRIVAMNFGDRR